MTAIAQIDLHLHTIRSDGRLTPTELVKLVTAQGVTVAAITDHDSTEGLDEAFAEAAHHPGLHLIPGIEMSVDHPGGGDLHLLGYFLEYRDSSFQKLLQSSRDARVGGAKRMVDKLAELGLPLDWERVQEIAEGASIGRPHIAHAMVERGYISSPKEAFNGYLEDGGKAHIPRPHIGLRDAVQLIKSVGGVSVLAHPIYVNGYLELVPQLGDFGVVGMEVHYAEYNQEQRVHLARLADRYGLVPCGGSDYHAFGTPGEFLPGSAGPPEESLQRLEALARALKSSSA